MRKKYSLRELDDFEKIPEDAIIVLDDRSYKYDEINDKIVRPGESGYDELPELIR